MLGKGVKCGMQENQRDFAALFARLPDYTRLAWRLYREPGLPRSLKALLLGGAAYTFSPLDLIPGFVPVAGQLDDLVVFLAALRKVLLSLDPAEREAHLRETGTDLGRIEADLKMSTDALRQMGRASLRSLGTGLLLGGRALALGTRAAGKLLSLVGRGASRGLRSYQAARREALRRRRLRIR